MIGHSLILLEWHHVSLYLVRLCFLETLFVALSSLVGHISLAKRCPRIVLFTVGPVSGTVVGLTKRQLLPGHLLLVSHS